MYQVAVYEEVTDHRTTPATKTWVLVEVKNFKYGEWKEIGFWLNDSEMIDEQYKVHIKFVNDN